MPLSVWIALIGLWLALLAESIWAWIVDFPRLSFLVGFLLLILLLVI